MVITTSQWNQKTENLFSKYFNKPKDSIKALKYAKDYCKIYDSMISDIFHEVFSDTVGITLCAFGSPARYEMLGQSDLDCMIIRENKIDITNLRKQFLNKLKKYDFSKLDIPCWGSLTECEQYLKTAITEGNQVVETRYISGDKETWKNLENIKDKHCTDERFRQTFCFQYLYFNQYYQQRERINEKNLKYGHGGTRDFLFPVWLANLREGYKYSQNGDSSILRGINSLLERENITKNKANKFISSVNEIALMRNELLRNSYDTEDSGLTYLNNNTASILSEKLPKIYLNKNKVLNDGLSSLKQIRNLKKICHSIFMNESEVNKRIGPNSNLNPKDNLCGIVMSWNSDLSKINYNYLNILLNSENWSVLTSLACNPTCPENCLDYLAELGTEPGYEYVLKVVGRNLNTRHETLNKIINSGVEYRFIEPAHVRLKKGWTKANEL